MARAGLELLKAAVFSGPMGQEFRAVVIAVSPEKIVEGEGVDAAGTVRRCRVQLLEPAVTAPCEIVTSAVPEPGTAGRVQLRKAEIDCRQVLFRWLRAEESGPEPRITKLFE